MAGFFKKYASALQVGFNACKKELSEQEAQEKRDAATVAAFQKNCVDLFERYLHDCDPSRQQGARHLGSTLSDPSKTSFPFNEAAPLSRFLEVETTIKDVKTDMQNGRPVTEFTLYTNDITGFSTSVEREVLSVVASSNPNEGKVFFSFTQSPSASCEKGVLTPFFVEYPFADGLCGTSCATKAEYNMFAAFTNEEFKKARLISVKPTSSGTVRGLRLVPTP